MPNRDAVPVKMTVANVTIMFLPKLGYRRKLDCKLKCVWQKQRDTNVVRWHSVKQGAS